MRALRMGYFEALWRSLPNMVYFILFLPGGDA